MSVLSLAHKGADRVSTDVLLSLSEACKIHTDTVKNVTAYIMIHLWASLIVRGNLHFIILCYL